MIKIIFVTLAILSAIAGCIAGTVLVDLTGNYWYYVVNAITGAAAGSLAAFALQEKVE